MCVVVGAAALKPGGCPKSGEWMEIDALDGVRSPPSAAATAVVVVVVMGLERERERGGGWMLKIYCVSHIDSFASAILATPPMHPRRYGGFKDDLTLFPIHQRGSLLRWQQETRS